MYYVLQWLGPLGGWLFRRGMYKQYYASEVKRCRPKGLRYILRRRTAHVRAALQGCPTGSMVTTAL